jgi:hypothetical protein
MHGHNLRSVIEKIQEQVRNEGTPVMVDGKGTVELLNKVYTFVYDEAINTDAIAKSMDDYYAMHGLDLKELQELEKDEYQKITDTLVSKFSYFDRDIHSRRVLWTDDCCISMVHYLVRNGTIYCYFHLRSSDVVYKLFSDLNLIHRITRSLQDKLGIYNTIIYCNSHSFHEIVLK